jgi:hypothetical protein
MKESTSPAGFGNGRIHEPRNMGKLYKLEKARKLCSTASGKGKQPCLYLHLSPGRPTETSELQSWEVVHVCSHRWKQNFVCMRSRQAREDKNLSQPHPSDNEG